VEEAEFIRLMKKKKLLWEHKKYYLPTYYSFCRTQITVTDYDYFDVPLGQFVDLPFGLLIF